jgi:23S rRNA (adenine2503-C2)-methyltransferase
MSLINIRNLSEEELLATTQELGEKSFRGKQLLDWIWNKGATDFESMGNLPKSFREKLQDTFFIDKLTLVDQQVSSDKTIKCAYETIDKRIVEGVLIPTSSRMTACISSQVGCSLSCKFCATGKLKLLRNLTPGEMVDQVAHLKYLAETNYSIPLSNIVYMGMGEPLLNYGNMIHSIQWITSEKGLGMSPKRITVSTAGIAKMIKKLGDDAVKFNLALSLHAANDKKRSAIMEINDSNNLEILGEALRYFHEKTGSRVTFEYIIFDNFNDSLEDAAELAVFARCVPCKINIIEYNPIDDGEFKRASAEKTAAFARFLEGKNLIVNVRRSRGKDIDAACGQLANKNNALLKEDRILKS